MTTDNVQQTSTLITAYPCSLVYYAAAVL